MTKVAMQVAKSHTTNEGLAMALAAMGYRRTSNRHCLVSRVDRPDWREHMAQKHAPWDPEGQGVAWVKCLGKGAADHYRRCYSNDTMTVGPEVSRRIPGSIWDETGYVEVT